jgi:hypothetical protein
MDDGIILVECDLQQSSFNETHPLSPTAGGSIWDGSEPTIIDRHSATVNGKGSKGGTWFLDSHSSDAGYRS